MHTKRCVHALVFSFTTSQMKSLHYDQCSFSTSIGVNWLLFTLFHRDETKPTHIIGINSFLFFIQLIYKHSSPNYQHIISFGQLINKMFVFLCVVCICWNIFNRIHFFASCDVVYAIDSCFMWNIDLWRAQKSWRSSFDKPFFSSYTIHFTLLVNCSNTLVLAEQSLHHNIILEKQDHCWVSRIYVKFLISESYITSLLHIQSKMRQYFCWFIFSHSPSSFFLRHHSPI